MKQTSEGFNTSETCLYSLCRFEGLQIELSATRCLPKHHHNRHNLDQPFHLHFLA